MVLKLYGSDLSPYTKTVGMILYEKQIAFEFHFIDTLKGEHKTSGHFEKQPMGQVPYIVRPPSQNPWKGTHLPKDDDGFVLYESRAIAWYLSTKYASQGTPLVPPASDIQATALLHQSLATENSNCTWIPRVLMEGLYKPKYLNLPVKQDVFQELVEKVEVILDGYERILSKSRYLGGDELTYVDFLPIAHADQLKDAGTNIMESDKRPNVLRWFNELRARPSWQENRSGVWRNAP